MSRALPRSIMLPGVAVPRSLLAAPERFGGVPAGECLTGDLLVQDGRAAGLRPATEPVRRLLLPRLCEPHVHLDKCHTIDRLDGVGGDLGTAIEAQARDREQWTAADIRARALRGVAELRQAGCGVIRSHVDWGETAAEPPDAWRILGEIAEDCPDIVVQRAALTGADRMADAAYARTVARAVARDGGVLGGFVYDQPGRAEGIRNILRLAEDHGLAVDFHVDEGLHPALNGLEMIADAALAAGITVPVLCSHACSLMNQDAPGLGRISGKLARAGIAVAALPSTNLYLQGRSTDGATPDRRGLTRLNELRAAGVTVVLGTDNVGDAFCPLGRHDPLETLSLASLAAHLDPPYDSHLPMITTDARRALGLPPACADGAAAGDLILFGAASVAELLRTRPEARPLTEFLEGDRT